MNGKVNFVKVDVDQTLDLANEYQISSLPTIVMFKDNQKIKQLVGFSPKEKIKEMIESKL
ncbi:thioredoxin family protein [Clostridium sp. DL-VIII]|uniref:thioredoxin family protein n=1 Tax=Clostridium sp. DL-VIII TaxID=641107 RepID=UPI000319369C|nr:thioredoxin family protein [Clostridium sp. DL-VIII]